METMKVLETRRPSIVRKTYDWVMHWAETPYGTVALFLLALCESSFFPIPPDVLVIALAISIPKKSFMYAGVCSVGSVIGGALGYVIGFSFMDAIGMHIIKFYGLLSQYDYIKTLYSTYDIWATAIAGFTPVPYKIFTIGAGAFHIDFITFLVVSTVSRSTRFFILGGLIYFFGSHIRSFIEKYFNLMTVLFFILLFMGFVMVKWFV